MPTRKKTCFLTNVQNRHLKTHKQLRPKILGKWIKQKHYRRTSFKHRAKPQFQFSRVKWKSSPSQTRPLPSSSRRPVAAVVAVVVAVEVAEAAAAAGSSAKITRCSEFRHEVAQRQSQQTTRQPSAAPLVVTNGGRCIQCMGLQISTLNPEPSTCFTFCCMVAGPAKHQPKTQEA